MKALLLVGGFGTRLRPVIPSLPKTLAPLGDRPFLELLLRQLSGQGINHLILCTGYLADQIEDVFQNGSGFGATIEYSKEVVPLGTAGALKLAREHVERESEFLVLNGDSFLETDFDKLIAFHRKHRALATMAVVSEAEADPPLPPEAVTWLTCGDEAPAATFTVTAIDG